MGEENGEKIYFLPSIPLLFTLREGTSNLMANILYTRHSQENPLESNQAISFKKSQSKHVLWRLGYQLWKPSTLLCLHLAPTGL